jgi:hypothetical protein
MKVALLDGILFILHETLRSVKPQLPRNADSYSAPPLLTFNQESEVYVGWSNCSLAIHDCNSSYLSVHGIPWN